MRSSSNETTGLFIGIGIAVLAIAVIVDYLSGVGLNQYRGVYTMLHDGKSGGELYISREHILVTLTDSSGCRKRMRLDVKGAETVGTFNVKNVVFELSEKLQDGHCVRSAPPRAIQPGWMVELSKNGSSLTYRVLGEGESLKFTEQSCEMLDSRCWL